MLNITYRQIKLVIMLLKFTAIFCASVCILSIVRLCGVTPFP